MIQFTNTQHGNINHQQMQPASAKDAPKLSTIIGCPEHLFSTDTKELNRRVASQ